MKDFTNFKKEFKKLLNLSDNIVITSHIGPDMDAIVSSLMMKKIVKAYTNKQVRVIIDKAIKYEYDFLNYIDQIELGDVSKSANQNTMLIVVDCNEYKRFTSNPENVSQFGLKVSIDHHEVDPDKFDLLLNEDTSSVAELLFCIFEKEIKWDKKDAQNIFTAMIDDNGGFMYGVGEYSFYTAYKLSNFNIDLSRIHENLLSLNQREFELVVKVLKESILFKNLGIFYINWKDSRQYSKLEITRIREYICKKVMHYIEDLKWFVIILPVNEHKTKARIISKDTNYLDSNKLAKQYNGGGHDTAAGITVDMTVEEVINEFKIIEDKNNF